MGTPKRERQKANRQQRLIEEHQEIRKATIWRYVIRGVIVLIGAIAAVLLIAWIGGRMTGDDEATTETTVPVVETTVPTATTVPVTYPVPETPEVELPAETPTELEITTLTPGSGPAAEVGDTVVVHYIGVLSSDGTVFDSSYERGSTYSVPLGLGAVIEGWDQGLVGAQAGERRQIDIPAELAYGENGAGDLIKPGDALTFVIDVMDVIKADAS